MAFLGLLMFFIANNNIFVLVKPHLKDIAVHFFPSVYKPHKQMV